MAIDVVPAAFGVEAGLVFESASFTEDVDAASLGIMEMVTSFKEELDVETRKTLATPS